MPTATRTFRVFVSSTFEDLRAERDALQRDVFPRLRKLCEENNARFQAIDLRWGVRDEAALDQQTMEICLREIERCQQTGIKPNFIVLLGERYGWRPLPARIEAGEFEQILSIASEEEKRRLKFEEGQPNRNGGWYRCDDNADPAEYILRPREVNVAPDASEADQKAARDHEAAEWKHTEEELRQIFFSAIALLGWLADDLRREKYEASATHQEILKGLGKSEENCRHVFAFFRESAAGVASALRDLCACRHLVVTLSSEGAVWLSNPGDPATRRGTLVFDSGRAEGEFDEESGRVAPYGSLSAMTASVVWRLWFREKELDFVPALKAGLSAARVLRECGHGLADKSNPKQGFPWDEVTHELCTPIVTMKKDADGKPTDVVEKMVLPRHIYSSVALPFAKPGPDAAGTSTEARPDPWTILKENTESAIIQKFWPKDEKLPPLSVTGRRLALYGPDSLSGAPYARFGKLTTMDRGDIESLRSIRQLMLRYQAEERPKTPLSIAVFGAPGSGKSFGLKQIAKGIFHEEPMEFNLSQFKGPEELYGAYHQVRDRVLAGATPVVFWDEFDSRELMWLQYLLAPMQDGVFQEGPLTHSIGKCVFVFAGGTSYDYKNFGPLEPPAENEDDEAKKARRKFIQKKGPDFKSRLTAYLNVLGPNPRKLFDRKLAEAGRDPWVDDPSDVEFPVRRAILLRGLLKYDATKELKIDPGLLTALLEVGHYRNGARSMEKLIGQIVADGSPVPSRAGLPPREIVEMLVQEVDEFYERLHVTGFGPEVETLAEKIHERFREKNREARKFDPKTPPLDANSDVPWAELPPDLKASNRAAAQRISQILAAVGLTVVPGTATKEESEAVTTILKSNLDMLARMEHDGWMDEKKMQGWTRGEVRDGKLLKHPLLITYENLPLPEKDKDRDSILEYPNRVSDAGYKIVFKNPELWPHSQLKS